MTKEDEMLVLNKLNNNISGIINKLNESINRSDDDKFVGTNNLANEFLETLEIIKECVDCKRRLIEYYYDSDINELNELFATTPLNELVSSMRNLDNELFKEGLCHDCKEKKINKLTEKCGGEDRIYHDIPYIKWIQFNEFKGIEYLAKGGFGEVHKATWSGYYNSDDKKFEERIVVLKRLYNSGNKMLDILNEVSFSCCNPKKKMVAKMWLQQLSLNELDVYEY